MLFTEQPSRKPNLYPWANSFIEALHSGFWTDREFTFQSDVQNFKIDLSKDEKEIVVKAMSAIGQVEISVKKFWAKMADVFKHPAIIDLGYTIAANEVIHSQAYLRLLDVLDLNNIFEEHLETPEIKGRTSYLKKHLEHKFKDDKKQYIYSLILFTLFIENVSLFSQFYIVMWFGRFKNVLKDTNQQILYTKNEELIHTKVGIQLIKTLRKEYPELFDEELENIILTECQKAFDYESKIVDWMVGDYEGERINKTILKEYIKSRFNESLKDIGYKKIFTVDRSAKRDFEWFNEEILGNNHTDFFHKRPVDYSKKSKAFDADDLF